MVYVAENGARDIVLSMQVSCDATPDLDPSIPSLGPESSAVLIADDHPLFRDALAQIVTSTLPHATVVRVRLHRGRAGRPR